MPTGIGQSDLIVTVPRIGIESFTVTPDGVVAVTRTITYSGPALTTGTA